MKNRIGFGSLLSPAISRTISTAAIILLSLAAQASSQNLLRMPESVVYDSTHSRYLASNYITGHIVAIDEFGQHSYFVRNEYCKNGLHIAGNVVYAACIDQGVKGFNLDDTSMVALVNIDGMVNLNDIASDTSGNLYVTDVFGNKIYKIRISDYRYSTFLDCGNYPPNGIYFDAERNRLLYASYKVSAPIMAVSLEDSSLSQVVNTGYSYLDGLTRDEFGNYYFSTWQTTSVYLYDSTFSGIPEMFYRNSNGPADIFYNSVLHEMAIPVMSSNAIVFIEFPTAIDNEIDPDLPREPLLSANYPNPFNGSTIIVFELPKQSDVSIEVYNVLGQLVETIGRGTLQAGYNRLSWDGSDHASGTYYYGIRAGELLTSGKMILLK